MGKAMGKQTSGTSHEDGFQAEDMSRLKTQSLSTISTHTPLRQPPCTCGVACPPARGLLSENNQRHYCVEPDWVQSWLCH